MGRIELLNKRWTFAQALDLKIQVSAKNEEEAYLSALDFLNTQLHKISSSSVKSGDYKQSVYNKSVCVKLSQISLPEFSGDYGKWENFRDLFNALIIKNDSLSNVTRLHYLKTSSLGEDSQLIKHITITNANFFNAWVLIVQKVKNYFEILLTKH